MAAQTLALPDESPAALQVPVAAVRRTAEGTVVFRRGDNGQPQPVTVTTGVVLTDAIEIRAGLRAGDVVAASAKAAP